MDRTIRQDFPEFGDGVYVTIKNPRLAPAKYLAQPRAFKDGDPQQNLTVMAEWHLWFIVSWHILVGDDKDWEAEPQPLGPVTLRTIERLPAEISRWITGQIMDSQQSLDVDEANEADEADVPS